MAIFSGTKIFKKNFFFVFFYILERFLSCLMKAKKIRPLLAAFWPPYALILVSLTIYIELWSYDTSFESTL